MDIPRLWFIGDVHAVRFEVEFQTFTVLLYQLDQETGWVWRDAATVAHQSITQKMEFDWVVQTYGMKLSDSDTFFFWLFNGTDPNERHMDEFPHLKSPEFRIREKKPEESSTSSIVTSTATTSTLSTTQTETSNTSTSSSSSSTNTPSPSENSGASGGGGSNSTTIGVGVGVGIAAVLILALFAGLWFRQKRNKNKNKGQEQPEAESPDDITAKKFDSDHKYSITIPQSPAAAGNFGPTGGGGASEDLPGYRMTVDELPGNTTGSGGMKPVRLGDYGGGMPGTGTYYQQVSQSPDLWELPAEQSRHQHGGPAELGAR